ncbi:hypothetical protein [Streptacidiphilus cavernicola]|uniref:Uncharacterized protein n=1 Tax=Streptacidiphilus cavernicola TaxID=3342716 RepID=A0ABV6VZ22_9ACTN
MDQPQRSWAEVLADEQERLDRAVARAQSGHGTPQARIRIDPDTRTDDGLVAVRASLAGRPVQVREYVTVYEPGRRLEAPAVVERVDGEWLHLRVEWQSRVRH